MDYTLKSSQLMPVRATILQNLNDYLGAIAVEEGFDSNQINVDVTVTLKTAEPSQPPHPAKEVPEQVKEAVQKAVNGVQNTVDSVQNTPDPDVNIA